jgi:hypothetical protein
LPGQLRHPPSSLCALYEAVSQCSIVRIYTPPSPSHGSNTRRHSIVIIVLLDGGVARCWHGGLRCRGVISMWSCRLGDSGERMECGRSPTSVQEVSEDGGVLRVGIRRRSSDLVSFLSARGTSRCFPTLRRCCHWEHLQQRQPDGGF